MKRSTARGSRRRTPEAAHLLEGLTVLDTASWVAGPAAATLMADFGAQVIKIEPPGGDSYREFVNAAGMPTSDVNYPWLRSNRSKKSVVLDLSAAEGREVLLTLVRGSDVLARKIIGEAAAATATSAS